MRSSVRYLSSLAILGASFLQGSIALAKGEAPAFTAFLDGAATHAQKITPYKNRFDRRRPVIAVLGENSGTELTDYVVPYAVLSQSGAAEVFAVATQAGPITMRPALRIQPQLTVEQFDRRFPEGADYLVVPAMVKRDDPAALSWISAQAAKGSQVMSICDGALVVANTGLLRDHRATAHWATQGLRAEKYPETHWLKNVRYVADGNMLSSAGISASMPISIALVEAIAGREAADALAAELGVSDWSQQHDSDRFQPKFGRNISAFSRNLLFNRWFHSVQSVGLPLASGADDIALAFTADAYSRTGRSQAFAVSDTDAPVMTRHGLMILPDTITAGKNAMRVDRMLPIFEAGPSEQVLDRVLESIAGNFGRKTAYGVALDLEYPGFQP